MDQFSLVDKLKRYANLGSTLGGLAARVIGKDYLGTPINNATYAKDLQQSLGSLKGPIMKVAQFLATIPDAIPPEYAAALMQLQSQAPPMSTTFVKRRMTSELGPEWLQKFQHFELIPSAAASLGQVHRAVSIDGKQIACKLQYPQMGNLVETDLQHLKALFSFYRLWNKAIDMTEIQREIKDRLLEELDYYNEAKQITIYQQIFSQITGVQIPNIYPELSTSRLLTMELMDGEPLSNFMTESADYRNQLAENLFNTWYRPLYHHGVIHGDPHPGNYLFKRDGLIQLLDFGCVRHFPGSFIQGVVQLYYALRDNRPEQAVAAYESWGFKSLTIETIDIMNQWARLLYDPLLEDRVRPIQRDFSAKEGWKLACELHARLNKSPDGIIPPAEFVFMDRSAVCLGGVFMRLRAELNWHRLFEFLLQSSPYDLS